MTKQLGIFVT